LSYLRFRQKSVDISRMGTRGRETAMPRTEETFDVEEWVITGYAALDDALAEAGIAACGMQRGDQGAPGRHVRGRPRGVKAWGRLLFGPPCRRRGPRIGGGGSP
jgi:hypothetical protein